ncbi:MAG TPA: voltage-gated chloride channel family protein [Puia sp.]
MKKPRFSFEQFSILSYLLRWTLLVIPVALTAGSLVALFLWLLDQATLFRFTHSWLLFLLPLAGVLIYFVYKYLGKNSEAGNNLIIDEIHEPGAGVPARMGPLVLLATVVTHLFGGSAGREGTAVQIGGSLANFFARRLHLSKKDTRTLLMTGVAAGFGAVFGTPVTGAIFALEVLALGKMQYDALMPCFMASVLADIVCGAWGIHHTAYHLSFADTNPTAFLKIDLLLLVKVIVAGVAFGLAGMAFAETTHAVKSYGKRWMPSPWLIPIAGGLIIIGLTYALGTTDYLGLGVLPQNPGSVTILSCFHAGGAGSLSWFWKLLFTAITLGTGFKGGEVTPLFFIGAALGNTLALMSGAPVDLMAGLGFIAVFAGATNTPVACTLMGVELFGAEHVLYYAVACFTAYYFSGHSGIYTAQRVGVAKVDDRRRGWRRK